MRTFIHAALRAGRQARSGYSPVCANEWVRGVCEKPKIKCAECQHRKFLPVTDEVIRCHLSGQDGNGWDFTMGLYPMLLDETCFFLAADFDKTTWQDDAKAFLERLPSDESAGGLGEISFRKWRTCLVVLQRARSSCARTPTRFAPLDRDNGAATRCRFGFLR